MVNLDIEADFIGKAALRRIKEQGVSRKQIGLIIEGAPLNGLNTTYWPIRKNGVTIGTVTSAVYSPRLKQNIALAMVATEHAVLGAKVEVVNRTGLVNAAGTQCATIADRPFHDPQKKIAAS